MDIIIKKFKHFLKIESTEIRKNFYNIEKRTNNYIRYKIIYKSSLHTTIYTVYFYIQLKLFYKIYNFFLKFFIVL